MIAEATPAGAEHRVRLPPVLRGREQAPAFVVELPSGLANQQLLDVGEELVQRRVEQPDGDGQAVHRLEDPLEVAALQLLELVERGVLLGLGVGEDEALDERQAVAEEHVLGAAEADALGAEPRGHLRVVREVGVGAHLQCAGSRRPSRGSCRTDRWASGCDQRHRADHHLAGRAVDRDHVALVARWHRSRERAGVDVDLELVRAAHRGRAHAAGDDRRVAHQAAARREDALGRDHPVEVVGRRLRAARGSRPRRRRGAPRRRRR